MYSIITLGKAGAGKSLLTSIIAPWYAEKGSDVLIVNLDPGVKALPYNPDIDIRDFIDIDELMNQYQLGPNGALILASDLIATKIGEIRDEIHKASPDYVFFDTPGQIELFSYRESGYYFINNISEEDKLSFFLFDSTLVSTPANFISIALHSASVKLRLQIPQISILSKRDLIGEKWKRVMSWSANSARLQEDMKDLEGDTYTLATETLNALVESGFGETMLPFSANENIGLVEIAATISRILSSGEEVQD